MKTTSAERMRKHRERRRKERPLPSAVLGLVEGWLRHRGLLPEGMDLIGYLMAAKIALSREEALRYPSEEAQDYARTTRFEPVITARFDHPYILPARTTLGTSLPDQTPEHHLVAYERAQQARTADEQSDGS